jgi:cytochrome P450
VPAEDHERFKRWSRALAYTVEPAPPAEALYAASDAAGEILDYFRSLVARKRSAPQDDLLSALVHAEEQGQRLSQPELLANAVLLLVAGHETTVNLIGNGVLALLEHRDQLERLRREPALIENAVEELLRYDSPVQITSRVVHEAVTVAGQAVGPGEEVMLLLGSANRDPDRFAEPDRLDVGRADCKHLSFGGGAHYCVGAPLARAEGQVAIGMLLERFGGLELADEAPPRRPSAALRGLRELRLAWR